MMTGIQPDSIGQMIKLPLLQVPSQTAQASFVTLSVEVQKKGTKQYLPGVTVLVEEGKKSWQKAVSKAKGPSFFRLDRSKRYTLRSESDLYEYEKTVIVIAPEQYAAADTVKVQLDMGVKKPDNIISVQVYDNQTGESLGEQEIMTLEYITEEAVSRIQIPQRRNIPRAAPIASDSPEAPISLTATVKDASNENLIDGAMIKLYEGSAYQSVTVSENNGSAIIQIQSPGNYALKTFKEGYLDKVLLLSTINKQPGEVMHLQINMEPQPVSKTLQVHSYEEGSSKPLANAKVYLLNEFTSEERCLQTDSAGNFSFPADPKYSYAVIVEKGNYSGMMTDIQPDSIKQMINLPVLQVVPQTSQTAFITLAVEVQEEGTEQRLPGVTVRVEEGMQPRQKAVSQAKEEMLFRLPATGHFNLKIQKENYHAKVVMVPWPVNGEETVKMIVRLQKELVSKTLQVHCYEEESSKPLANAKVYLLNEFTSEEKFLQTDSAGNFSFPAEPRYFYAVIVEKGDYTGMITDIQPDSIRQIINLPAQNVRLYNSHTGKPAVLAQTTSARQSSELTSDLVPSWPVSGRPAKSSPSLPADSLAATVAGTQKQRATTQPRTLRTTQAGDARTVAGTQKRQELPQPDTLRKEDPISGRPAKSSSAGWGARTIAGTQKQRATIQPDTLRTTQVGDARTIAGTPNRRQTAQPDTLRKEEFNAGNIKQKVVLTMPSVYYKPDKYTVANEMTAQLDSIAELMKEDAQYKLIISSYTDSRQSHWYNEQLSAKRSQAARQYLVAKGVNKKRIMNKYYGERMLVNECKDGIDCEEAKHQENRRTDFTLYLPNRVAKRKSS
jgi:outer membrane protein OmpA-like peptidoglycan-associated protein